MRYCESEAERKKAGEIQADAKVICQMILDESYQDVGVEIARERLKEKVKKLFPEKMETYRMIYVARFNRLRDRFRH